MAIDYSEVAIDQILENEILSELPIVKTIYNTFKVGIALKERHFAKKILSFFREFHSGNISGERHSEFVLKLSR